MPWLRSMVVVFVLGAATAGVCADSPVDTTGWPLYRSDGLGFDVRHPSTWVARTSTGTMESVALSEPPRAGGPQQIVQFIVQRAINPGRRDIKQWYAEQLKKVTSSPPVSADTTLAGRPAVRMEHAGSSGRQFSIFTRLNETDLFQVIIRQPSGESRLEPIYEAILATVRFTK